MTSEHLMQHRALTGQRRSGVVTLMIAFAAVVVCSAQSACEFNRKPGFVTPATLESPYNAHRSADRTVTVWAVAPMRNESGTSTVDPMRVSDALVAQLQQVRGIQVLSLNRTMAVMRTIGLTTIESQADATKLAKELGVDAIVAGTITAYDPYEPVQFGLALALLAPNGSPIVGDSDPNQTVDPVALQAAGTDFGLSIGGGALSGPLSVVAMHYDGANHDVQQSVHHFAQGRSDSVTAMGWEQYLASMRLFTTYACYDATARLLYQEQQRLTGAQRAAVQEE